MPDPSAPSIECPSPELAPGAQGILRVAVDDSGARLIVTLGRPMQSPAEDFLLDPRSYTLTGGRRLFPQILSAAAYGAAAPPDQVQLTLDEIGDFSTYTLTLNGPEVDPFYASHKLRFRLDCDDPFDCRAPAPPPAAMPELPVTIDYLSKDYAGFRQALTEFLDARWPQWTERSEADLGMMLLELFAAEADQLSYTQDRVSNEAFLATASQRRSVAGHLALLGYRMDEGASAYTWLRFQVAPGFTPRVAAGFRVTTRALHPGEPVIVFETLVPARLSSALNELKLYTWGNQNCCLPAEASRAQLVGQWDELRSGDWLLFEDPKAGVRDVVRLSAPPLIVPPGTGGYPGAVPSAGLTVVSWSPATPLRNAYCVADAIACGNVVPATHGETVLSETLQAPGPPPTASGPGQRVPRLRLPLSQAPLAHLDPSARALVDAAEMQQTLQVSVGDSVWQEVDTLVNRGPQDLVYRVEIDDEGDAAVVFGDGTLGQRPPASAAIMATYRVGGGQAGNVGQDTLTVAQPRTGGVPVWLQSVTNPLPATGGRDLESSDHARRTGPALVKDPLVAVTAHDYQTTTQGFVLAGGRPVQRARAEFRWTGSWLTVTVSVDPRATETLSADLRKALLDFLDTRRLAGYDLEIRPANYLSIDLTVEFCAAPGFLASDVRQRLLLALGSGTLAGGGPAFFSPDNFSFGDCLYVSRLEAAIMAVPGVQSAEITTLARQYSPDESSETQANKLQGFLQVGADQILRLDNDPSFPENGTLTVTPKGAGA